MLHHITKAVSNYHREQWYLNALLKDDLYQEPAKALRMYVAVRSDILPPINQGIQALHAVVEYPIEADGSSSYWEWSEKWKTVVLLGADEISMGHLILRAKRYKVRYVIFQEPDLDNEITATAFEPMTAAKGKDLFFGYRRAE